MTKIVTAIKEFFMNIWNFRSILKLKALNKKLSSEVKNQNEDRTEFLKGFRSYLRKYLKYDASGKYIPLTGKNKAEIHATIMATYGPRLKKLNLKFTKKLQIKL